MQRARFQSTRPCGARRTSGRRQTGPPNFNPRALVGRDVARTAHSIAPTGFQSTRPCGARHGGNSLAVADAAISIHAPLWGATGYILSGRADRPISIHAPLWGATTPSPRCPGAFKFQSTRPCGARPGVSLKAAGWTLISIHAPLWGATRRARARPRRGPRFQSTRPCGARRRCAGVVQADALYFNPRALVGRDHDRSGVHFSDRISIHAPLWGATANLTK